MEVVKAFNDELSHLCDTKPPVSRATMAKITKAGMKAVKFYKHVVQSVEKFIAKCRPEYKVAGLYVLDSIVRQSRHQFGVEKDVFAQRFSNNIANTFQNLLLCPEDDKIRIAKVIQLWQKSNVFSAEILDRLITCMEQNSADGSAAITMTENDKVEVISEELAPSSSAVEQKQSNEESKNINSNKEDLLLSFLKIVRDTPHQKTEIDRLLKLVSGTHPHLVPQLTQLMQLYCAPAENTISTAPAPIPAPVTAPKPLPGFTAQNFVNIGVREEVSQPPTRDLLGGAEESGGVTSGSQISKKIFIYDYGESDEEGEINEIAEGTPIYNAQSSAAPINNNNLAPQQINSQRLQWQQMPQQKSHLQEIVPAFPQKNNPAYQINSNSNKSNDNIDDDEVIITDDYEEGEYHDRHHRTLSPKDRSHHRSREKSRDRKHRSRSRDRKYRSRSRDRIRNKERSEWDRENQRKNELPRIETNKLCICSTTIFIGRLSKNISNEELTQELSKYGEITTMNLIPPRGCAFVTFTDRMNAQKALHNLKGSRLQASYIKCAWAISLGLKESNFENLFDVEEGVAHIPWSLLDRVDLVKLSQGAQIDEQSFSPQLKAAYEKALAEKGAQSLITHPPNSNQGITPLKNPNLAKSNSQLPPLPINSNFPQNFIPLPNNLPHQPPNNVLQQNFTGVAPLMNADNEPWMRGQLPNIPSYPPPPFHPRMPIQFPPFNPFPPYRQSGEIMKDNREFREGMPRVHQFDCMPPRLPYPHNQLPNMQGPNIPRMEFQKNPTLNQSPYSKAPNNQPIIINTSNNKLPSDFINNDKLLKSPPSNFNTNVYSNLDFKNVPPPQFKIPLPHDIQVPFGISKNEHPRIGENTLNKEPSVRPLMDDSISTSRFQQPFKDDLLKNGKENDKEKFQALFEKKTIVGKNQIEDDPKSMKWRNRYAMQSNPEPEFDAYLDKKTYEDNYDRFKDSDRYNDRNRYDDVRDKRRRDDDRGYNRGHNNNNTDERRGWGRDRERGSRDRNRKRGGERNQDRRKDNVKDQREDNNKIRDDDRRLWKRKRENETIDSKNTGWSDFFQDGQLDVDRASRPVILEDLNEVMQDNKKLGRNSISSDKFIGDKELNSSNLKDVGGLHCDKKSIFVDQQNLCLKNKETDNSCLPNTIQSRLLQLAGISETKPIGISSEETVAPKNIVTRSSASEISDKYAKNEKNISLLPIKNNIDTSHIISENSNEKISEDMIEESQSKPNLNNVTSKATILENIRGYKTVEIIESSACTNDSKLKTDFKQIGLNINDEINAGIINVSCSDSTSDNKKLNFESELDEIPVTDSDALDIIDDWNKSFEEEKFKIQKQKNTNFMDLSIEQSLQKDDSLLHINSALVAEDVTIKQQDNTQYLETESINSAQINVENDLYILNNTSSPQKIINDNEFC